MRDVIIGFSVFAVFFSITSALFYTTPLNTLALSTYADITEKIRNSAQVVQASSAIEVAEIQEIKEPIIAKVVPPSAPDLSDSVWEEITPNADWVPRDSAASFVFDGKMWIMGGLNGNGISTNANHAVHYWEAPHFNDIWSSEDGRTWKQELAHAAWPARRSMSVVLFNDTLWMFGGWSQKIGYANDIWKSKDSVHWTLVMNQAPWSAREGQTVEVFQDKIWLMGGVNYDTRETKNDVWYSEDGITWTEATTSAPWSSRWDHATAVFNDKIFLTGGMNIAKNMFRDVWSSTDGITWELVIESPPWLSRQGHSLAVHKDALWSIGRLNDDEVGGVNDVWYSEDGSTWKKTDVNPEWVGREDHGVLVFKDHIYVLGGMDSEWKWRNDVWKLK